MENNTKKSSKDAFPQRYEKTKGGQTYLDLGDFLKEVKVSNQSQKIDLEKLNLSTGIKAEMMWKLFKEFRKETWRDKKVEKDKELRLSLLKNLWEDEKVRDKYKKEYSRHKKEEKEINGDKEKYKFLKQKNSKLDRGFDNLSAKIFGQRGSSDNELLNILYNTSKLELEENRKEIEDLLSNNHELKAISVYNQLSDYERQLRNRGFAWLPSRKDALRKIESAVISGRPVLIESESGTGKTVLVKEVAKKLTGQEVTRLVGKSDVKPEKLFATPDFSQEGGHYRYGPITEAITGKESEKDEKAKHSGRIVFDDEWNKRTSDHQMEIVKTVSEIKPNQKFNVPDTAIREKVQSKYAFIAAGNPNSDRYERQDTDIAVRREFGSNKIDLDYPEQNPNNPELFSLLLSSLMEGGRLRVNEDEIKPKFVSVDKKYEISENPESGGFLWRFAGAWRSMFDSFKHQENILSESKPTEPKENFYLDKLLLDMGVVLGWMKEYKRNLGQVSLEEFLSKKTLEFITQADEERDQRLAKDIFKAFNIDLDKEKKIEKKNLKILTPKDIGEILVGPKNKEEVKLEKGQIMDESGKVINYINEGVGVMIGFSVGKKFEDKDGNKFILKGITVDEYKGFGGGTENFAVLEDADGVGSIIPTDFLRDTSRYQEVEEGNREKRFGVSIEKAKEIFGDGFYGPEQVKKAFSFEFPEEEIPPINASIEELEKAKKAGEELVLFIDHDNEGYPMTLRRMNEIMANRMGNKKLLYSQKNMGSPELDGSCWYKDQEFFKQKSIKTEWRLVGGDYIPNTEGKNGIEQTKLLRDYLINLGAISQEEVDECSDGNLNALEVMIDQGKKNKVTRIMSQMKIEEYKPSMAELIYQGILRDRNGKERGFLKDKYVRTRDFVSGRRVFGGRFTSHGFSVYSHGGDDANSDLVLSTSRKLRKIEL